MLSIETRKPLRRTQRRNSSKTSCLRPVNSVVTVSGFCGSSAVEGPGAVPQVDALGNFDSGPLLPDGKAVISTKGGDSTGTA